MFGRRKVKKLRGFQKREIKIVNKPVYENPYFKRRKPGFILRLIKSPKRVILILILLGVGYFLFYSNFFRIDVVDIQGTQELTYDRVRYEINKAFVVRRFIIFRQSNIFIYDKKEAEKALWDTFVLNEIKIKKRLPNKIIVTLKEKIPNLTLISQNKYYYLDLKGTVTHEIPEEEVKAHFPKVEDRNDRDIRLKDEIFSEKIVQAIFELQEDFPGRTNTNIERFLIPEISCPKEPEPEEIEEPLNENTNQSKIVNDRSNLNRPIKNFNTNSSSNKNTNSGSTEGECELAPLTQDIEVKTEEGWKAVFTTTESLSPQLERLKIYLLKKALDQESRENIDYIDLRFGEKIYVKEK